MLFHSVARPAIELKQVKSRSKVERRRTALQRSALAALFPEDPPLFLARTPHGHHDTTSIEARLRRAGFGGVIVESVAKKSTASSPRDPALGFCQGTPMRNEISLTQRCWRSSNRRASHPPATGLSEGDECGAQRQKNPATASHVLPNRVFWEAER
jgi:hypothetical protein